MGALAFAYNTDSKYEEIIDYLSAGSGYFIKTDRWMLTDNELKDWKVKKTSYRTDIFMDFSTWHCEKIRNEVKYYICYNIEQGLLSPSYIYNAFKKPADRIGSLVSPYYQSMADVDIDRIPLDKIHGEEARKAFLHVIRPIIRFIRERYDERDELEKDIWRASRVPGIKISAVARRTKPSMSFEEIPEYYKAGIKRYMKLLIYRRSWDFCTELLMYLRYFYRVFYEHGYADGFQERLSRKDMEGYLGWVAGDYEHNNATFRSKAVSFIRNYLDFIQLAEYETAPGRDINRLLFDEDIPKRERAADTMEKVKYIPEPVRDAIDASINDIEPAEMKDVYMLLRETGWRGTDILNLRYDKCLDYVWNSQGKEYVPYLYGEITKTGIPLHKIPIRQEVADMVSRLVEEAKAKSTNDNNPDRYLFNTYEGKCKGLPYSKAAFASAVQELIDKKEICDKEGNIYHFRTHSLRHTRAVEYTEQGMPLGIIQQILGHCSLQMTLHYAKVSEDMLYKKWSETETLNLFKPEVAPPDKSIPEQEDIHYDHIRKNLDAVRVPFGVCFKPTKIVCKNQMSFCLECSSFCTTKNDLPEYEAEIRRVEEQIKIGERASREEWIEKNKKYLENLNSIKERLQQDGIVHKNGKLREDSR